MHVVKPYLSQGHHVFADRYYTSIPLAQALKDFYTSFAGTIVKNRADLPDEIRGWLPLGDGEVLAIRDGYILALVWRAASKNKPVIMLSMVCFAGTVAVPARRSGSEPQTKPVVVHTYNQHLNGVDIADQHAVYYSLLRKTVKWWRKLFFWVVETAVVNSYVIHITTLSRPNHLVYRQSIVERLASQYIASALPHRHPGRLRKRSHPEECDPERLNQQLYLLDKGSQSHDYVVCSVRAAERHRTPYYCKTCADTPSVCPHRVWHATTPWPTTGGNLHAIPSVVRTCILYFIYYALYRMYYVLLSNRTSRAQETKLSARLGICTYVRETCQSCSTTRWPAQNERRPKHQKMAN